MLFIFLFSVTGETFTILNLMEKCKSVFFDLDIIYYLNHDVLEVIPINCDPHEKSCRLLHVLWNHLSHLSLKKQSSSSVSMKCVCTCIFAENILLKAFF